METRSRVNKWQVALKTIEKKKMICLWQNNTKMIKNKNIIMFKQNRSSILKHDKMTASYLISKSNRISTNKAHKDTMVKILKHKRNMIVEEKYIKKRMKGRKLNEDPSIGTKVDKK